MAVRALNAVDARCAPTIKGLVQNQLRQKMRGFFAMKSGSQTNSHNRTDNGSAAQQLITNSALITVLFADFVGILSGNGRWTGCGSCRLLGKKSQYHFEICLPFLLFDLLSPINILLSMISLLALNNDIQ